MAQSSYKSLKKEARDTFFLYVVFPALWTGFLDIFDD